jgi:hypothetical protein
MLRIYAFAIAAVISVAAYVSSYAVPIAPLLVKGETSIAQVHYYRHHHHAYWRYFRGYPYYWGCHYYRGYGHYCDWRSWW